MSVVSAALSSCIVRSDKRCCLSLETWIPSSWGLHLLSWLLVSHGKVVNKAWPSKINAIIWDKKELLYLTLLLLCTTQVGCFPSLMIKGDIYFPFCAWKRMLSRFALCCCSRGIPEGWLAGRGHSQPTVQLSIHPLVGAAVSWQLISKVPLAGELQGWLTIY